MERKDRILEAIYEAVDEVNTQLPQGRQLEKSPDTVLFGESGKLDSLGLVSLIVATEQKAGDKFDVALTLADERAMSMHRSPFRSIGTLAEYVGLLLESQTK